MFREWTVTFTFELPTFSNTFSNRFFIPLSISFKYYFFHLLFILFLIITHLPAFSLQYLIIIIEKNIWRMNSSPSDLMSYCSWAKNKYRYRESIREWTLAYFVGLLSKVKRILCLALLLEMLLGGVLINLIKGMFGYHLLLKTVIK